MMQTFLPYQDFQRSAKALDNKRLGKQRVEAMQLLKATREGGAWSNHPAAKMWWGYEPALEQYMRACVVEWLDRGFANSIAVPRLSSPRLPSWLGNLSFHAAHRSNLIRKDPIHYGSFGWLEPNNLEYIWPVP